MADEHEKDKDSARRAVRVEAVRNAVDQAFSATAGQGAAAAESGRERAQDIVDQLAQAAGRVRDVLDELRPPTADDLRGLRDTVADLERRVAALEETQAQGKPATAERPPKKNA